MTAAAELKPGSQAELNNHCRVAIDARGVATLTMCNAGPLVIFGTPVITAVREGIERVHRDHPDVHIVCAAIDRGLNERGFIVPGLGDAGDRLYGTK